MSCVANGHPTPVIMWLKNSEPLIINNITIFAKTHSTEDSTTSSLTLFNIQLNDKGNYSCNSSNHLVTTIEVLSEESPLSVLCKCIHCSREMHIWVMIGFSINSIFYFDIYFWHHRLLCILVTVIVSCILIW